MKVDALTLNELRRLHGVVEVAERERTAFIRGLLAGLGVDPSASINLGTGAIVVPPAEHEDE